MTSPDANGDATLGELLAQAMQEANVSIAALGRLLNPGKPHVAERNVYRWLAGDHEPDEENAGKLARLLGKPRDHFLTAPPAAPRLQQLEQRLAEVETQVADLRALFQERLAALETPPAAETK